MEVRHIEVIETKAPLAPCADQEAIIMTRVTRSEIVIKTEVGWSDMRDRLVCVSRFKPRVLHEGNETKRSELIINECLKHQNMISLEDLDVQPVDEDVIRDFTEESFVDTEVIDLEGLNQPSHASRDHFYLIRFSRIQCSVNS